MQAKTTTALSSAAKPHILVIEDNEGDIELMRIAFEALDYDMMFMHSAADGLSYLQKMPAPDLILLDLNMPNISGKEFLENIKNDERLSAIPVLLLTSSTAPQDIQDCYRLRANGYIVKPFGVAERADMVKYVTHLLQKKQVA